MSNFRIEHDSMGELKVPADALWGAQTQRAVENFPISGLTMPREFIRALGLIKACAAEANLKLGYLKPGQASAIRKAAERGYAFLEVDFIAAGPREEPVKLFAILGNPLVRASPKFRALATFHDHIFESVRSQQWTKARELIDQCRKLSGASQQLYDLHLARVAWFEKHPPGSDWDGAFRQVVK